uniref:Uncharacterized protein LOC102804472 isoform X1 n=1 Tax=Saccoglossus kowalevskii TaxID=10224 RepID=A0ABM0N0B2_SACKO|nr:PREDICTED: uncharacterized protein LOC102804472 isoform X1 [Saccoglossus kowalevskii]XP_006825704.1 PREDICTED: uncharacterized protein LOC102804472 isoform X2 [Saccoglossus kowalevskii]
MQRKQELGMDDAEHEFRDLKKIKVECAEWIHTATILVQELLGGGSLELFKPLETEPPEKKYDESIAQTPEPPKSTEVVEETKEETPGVESQEEKEQPTEKIAADEKVNCLKCK